MILSLVSRGIAAVPHANRPFGLLFSLPVGLFRALLEAAWLVPWALPRARGVADEPLLLRLAPGRPEWALLAGVFAAAWAPSDWLRLNSIYSSAYAGVTATPTLLSLWLLATSAGRPVLRRRCRPPSASSQRESMRGPCRSSASARRLWSAARARGAGAQSWRWPSPRSSCRSLAPGRKPPTREVLGVYLDVAGLGARLAEQFRLHLGPLFWAGRGLLGLRALVSALIVFVRAPGANGDAASGGTPRGSKRDRRHPRGGGGVLRRVHSAPASARAPQTRTQMVAGPWIAIAVAAETILLLARACPPARAAPRPRGAGSLRGGEWGGPHLATPGILGTAPVARTIAKHTRCSKSSRSRPI